MTELLPLFDINVDIEMMHYNILKGYSTENIINEQMVYELNAFIKVRDFIELSQILERLVKHEEICDMENKLLYADLDRTIKGKPFMEFMTKKVETLL